MGRNHTTASELHLAITDEVVVFEPERREYGLITCYRLDVDDSPVLRTRIRHDAHEHQSHALVELLSEGRSWTPVAFTPASDWHHGVGPFWTREAVSEDLRNLAESLVHRAVKILGLR